jgi:hypothetical protein
VAGFPCGAHDLTDKGLRLTRSAATVADTTRPDAQVVVELLHEGVGPIAVRILAVGTLITLAFWNDAPSAQFVPCAKISTSPTTCARQTSALLSSHPRLPSP